MDFKLYLSDKFEENELYPATQATIIAPSGSYAETYAKEKDIKFITSDKRESDQKDAINVNAKGRSICTTVAGLRFGFDWSEIPEIQSCNFKHSQSLLQQQYYGTSICLYRRNVFLFKYIKRLI